MPKDYRNYGKVSSSPKRPFEKERLDAEMKLCGEFGTCGVRAARLPRCVATAWRMGGPGVSGPCAWRRAHAAPAADACCVRTGLRCKREIHRVSYALSKMRSVARHLLTLPVKVGCRGCRGRRHRCPQRRAR
jgi:hypothetical protein